jgi:hypothetical protein
MSADAYIGEQFVEQPGMGVVGDMGWGEVVIEWMVEDVRSAFAEREGFSPANLMSNRIFAEGLHEEQIVRQAVGQLPACVLLLGQIKIIGQYN